MAEPLITVLTAVRNGEGFILDAVASIQEQTVDDWEYVIVDDASQDRTVAIIERAIGQDQRLRLIRRSESSGPYVAANEGLHSARGRYVARIDADDIAAPERFARQLAFLAENGHLRACGGFHQAISRSGERFPEVRSFPVLPGVIKWRLCLAADPAHSSAFVERAAFLELGGYRPLPLAQDWRLWCELSRRGWLGIVPEVVAYRRVHGDRLTDREAPRQARFATEVAQEHIHALSGEMWSADDVELLRRVAHGRPEALRDGLAILDRWATLWKNDEGLSAAECERLVAWTRMIKRRHVADWGERLPGAGPVVRAGRRTGAFLKRAGSGTIRHLSNRS